MSDPNTLKDFQQGNRFLVARDYKKAIECFLRHAQTNPQECAKAYVQVAECFRHINTITEPKHVHPAVTLVFKGDRTSAEHYYRLALEAEANNFKALRGLAEVLPQAADERLLILQRAARVQPNYMVLIYLGDFYRTHRKDFSRAYDAYRRAQEHNPLAQDAYRRLNDICRRLGRPEEAAEWSARWKQARQRKPAEGK
jgi:tetratricopeptide (TPR) repeat protein